LIRGTFLYKEKKIILHSSFLLFNLFFFLIVSFNQLFLSPLIPLTTTPLPPLWNNPLPPLLRGRGIGAGGCGGRGVVSKEIIGIK
jgi:hypothetical protein